MAILAGDVGGTKVHLALFHSEERDWFVSEKYPSAQHASLEEIVKEFLSRHRHKVEKACFGVAGPVRAGACRATNLPWIIESSKLAQAIGLEKVALLNDLEANAHGIRCLRQDELLTIQTGEELPGNRALIAAGTGLGEAGLFWDGERHRPFACEGGHSSFAPETDLEVELLLSIKRRYSHVSYERLLSGSGIVLLYRFLIESGYETPQVEVLQTPDPARAISQGAVEKRCPACMRTLDWFVQLYGSETGNLCLKMLAVGGVYIGGGIAPKIAPFFKTGAFIERMIAKGRFSSLLSRMPVRLILNENTALLGAADYVR